jgi:murein peptide amidase A
MPALLASALLGVTLLAVPQTVSQAQAAASGAVIGKRVIGHSVTGRPIVAWHLGQPGKPKAVVIASMHGNETAPRQILRSLRDGARIHGVDLWVIPTYNPDGVARDTRKNAHGVDLNRNFPFSWRDLDGNYESGPRPASEPETRAAMTFLRDVKPRWIVSFHQPLHGVDRDTKWPKFAHRLAANLNLPLKRFACGGVCHGTMTMWYNHHFGGAAVTVEYGAHPGRHRMRVVAPRQLLKALGGWR